MGVCLLLVVVLVLVVVVVSGRRRRGGCGLAAVNARRPGFADSTASLGGRGGENAWEGGWRAHDVFLFAGSLICGLAV